MFDIPLSPSYLSTATDEIVWQGVATFSPYSMGCADHTAYLFVFVISKADLDNI